MSIARTLEDVQEERINLIERVKKFIHRRRYAYQSIFKGPLAEIVLRDLANFCRAHTTTFHADSRVQAHLEGRREVWLRIQSHLKLSEDELWQLQRKEI